jgi:hypothetical protein
MKKIILAVIVLAQIAFISCNDDFLEKYPQTDLTEENAFLSYDNYRSFMYPCYDMFSDNTIDTSPYQYGGNSVYRGDFRAGYLGQKNGQNGYATQSVSRSSSGNGWSFTYIRRVNLMLSHLDDGVLTEEEARHWRATGYFFHSYWYMELINRFGDVPWIDEVLGDTSEEAYGERSERKWVADQVLERLIWAEENIGSSEKDGDNTITQDCVRAVISRFTLREGTWRKYHNLGDYDKYFTACAKYSELLMASYPALYYGVAVNDKGEPVPGRGYGEMWTSDDLNGVAGVILSKRHVGVINPHRLCDYEHIASHAIEMPQHTVDMYLCRDGRPVSTSAVYEWGENDRSIHAVFRNRDPRLWHVVMPPFRVLTVSQAQAYQDLEPYQENGIPADKNWYFTNKPEDREFIDIFGANHGQSVSTATLPFGGDQSRGMKRLPTQNWGNSPMNESPHLNNAVRTNGAYQTSNSGYYVWKFYNNWDRNTGSSNTNSSDIPVFKIEEVLLNYAECKYEQGEFTQSIADQTVNKLRDRAGMPSMVVAEINGSFDPNRGTDDSGSLINPLLWEIRRERMIELMGEGFGFYDIRRWKCAKWYVNRQQTGMWIDETFTSLDGAPDYLNAYSTVNPSTKTARQGVAGHIYRYPDPVSSGYGWLDKYYLYCVPTDEIALNPNLAQNPGWDE